LFIDIYLTFCLEWYHNLKLQLQLVVLHHLRDHPIRVQEAGAPVLEAMG
jgi:hypothetical protein